MEETTALKTLPSELNTIVSDSSAPRPRRRACVATLVAAAMLVAAVAAAGAWAARNGAQLTPAQLAADGGPNGDDDYHPCLGEPRPCHEPTAATSSAAASALASSRESVPAAAPAAAPSPVALPNKKPTYTGYAGGAGDAGGANLAPTIDDDDPVAISLHDDAFRSPSELDAAGSDAASGGPNGDDDYHPCLGKPRPCHEPTVSASAPAPAPILAQ